MRGWVVNEIIGIGLVNTRATARISESDALMPDPDKLYVAPIPHTFLTEEDLNDDRNTDFDWQ